MECKPRSSRNYMHNVLSTPDVARHITQVHIVGWSRCGHICAKPSLRQMILLFSGCFQTVTTSNPWSVLEAFSVLPLVGFFVRRHKLKESCAERKPLWTVSKHVMNAKLMKLMFHTRLKNLMLQLFWSDACDPGLHPHRQRSLGTLG